jgi:hypothetical protein
LLITRETVLREVPATRATSLMFARFMGAVVDGVSWGPLSIQIFVIPAKAGTQRLCSSS